MNLNRFVRVGQNTPLTCVYMTGFEFNDTARDKIQSAGATYRTATPSPHQVSGNGGSRYRGYSGAVTTDTFIGFPQLREFVVAFAMYLDAAGSSLDVRLTSSADGARQMSVFPTGTTGVVSVLRNTTTLASSSASAVSTGQWNWYHTWGYVDNSAGFAHVRIGSWSNEIVTLTGADTQQSASNNYIDQPVLVNSSGLVGVDDFMVFARSMYYHGGAGTAPSSGTITGSTSGATATVTSKFDNGSGSGCFFVSTVSGTFQSGETITASGWSGIANNALGNNEASLWVKEQYIIKRTISSDVLTGWTSTTAGGGTHYTEVDDDATTTDYVSTSTANQTDEYGTTGSLPPGAEIEAVCASAYARLNGVSSATNIRVGMDDGAADIDADADSALSGSWEVHDLICTNNPNTGTKFTTTEIGNLHLRITSKA